MDMKFSLELPREAVSIPVIRRVLGDTLRDLGVTSGCTSDILVAACEACTNALRYGGPDRRYEIAMSITDRCCVLKVVDQGEGFDPDSVSAADEDTESGRGLQLMRALVDDMRVDTKEEQGTVVYLRKRLAWAEEAALPRLAADVA